MDTVSQPKRLKQTLRLAVRLGFRMPCDEHGKRSIFERREFRKQMVKLIDETDAVAAQRCAARIVEHPGRNAVERNIAPSRLFEQTGCVQQR